ncbi:MAG: FAD/NAD(P)-binding protein [Patescibacteria group bacterium]|nr:FAD/NAD(P)-binding protein [Patescibacteria group bacterium]
MKNSYQPKIAVIKKIKIQTPEVKLFTLQFKNKEDQKNFEFIPGQFIEVGLPSFSEAPFAVCSNPNDSDKNFQICVRIAGQLTKKIHQLKINDQLTVRGPFGNGFPNNLTGNILLIGGGLGLVPLRPLILANQNNRNFKMQIFYGACEAKDLLFQNEYKIWQKSANLALTLDKQCPNWKGNVGLITTLFDKIKVDSSAIAILCGPPVMYKFVIQKLKQAGLDDANIFLSLERRMHCGIGVCQHCSVGSKYACKHGPIFSYQELKNIPGAL